VASPDKISFSSIFVLALISTTTMLINNTQPVDMVTSETHVAYFSDRGRLFQADRGRRIGIAVAALGRRAGTW
jgi:hypothetical protein